MVNGLQRLSVTWVALLGYSVAALLLTWPLAAHFTTHMPGNGIDDPALGWNLWWIKHRLLHQLNPDLFHTSWMFHPIQLNLAFYTLTPLNGLLSIPLQLASDLIVANNLLILSSFILSGYGAYLLARHLLLTAPRQTPSSPGSDHLVTLSPAQPFTLITAAFCAGLVYAFASAKLFYAALGQYNIASSQWIPFCVLYVLRIGRATSAHAALRNASLAALFLVLQAWAELTYASFLLIFIALYVCALFVARFRLPFTIRHSPFTILSFVLLGFIFLLGISPFLWAMLPDLRSEGDFFTSGGGFSDHFSADLAGYLFPTRLHPVVGDWVAGLPFPNNVGQHIYIGYSAWGMALLGAFTLLRNTKYGIRNRNIALFWLFNTFLFGWLTLGPQVRWWGRELPIPGPFVLISLLPFFNGNRYPSRYGVMVLLCIAVLVGYGVWRRNATPYDALPHNSAFRIPMSPDLLVPLSFSLLFLFEHLSLPLPLYDFGVPAIYQRLAAEPGDFALLELPTGWRNGARVLGKSDKLIMLQEWYQTVHGKRRLGGNTSRNPPDKFQYFTNAPLIGDLIALMNADREHLSPVINQTYTMLVRRNQPIVAQVLAQLGVRWVTIHVEKSPPALLRFVADVLPLTLIEEWHGVDGEGQPSTIRLYRVHETPLADGWEIDLAGPLAPLALGEGWSSLADGAVRYATRPQATLLLPLPSAGGTLELALHPPTSGVYVAVNGRATPGEFAGPQAGWLKVDIPPGVANALTDRVTLTFSGLPQTPTVWGHTSLADGQSIGQSGVRLPVTSTVVVQSAGEEVGDFAHIWVNGMEMARHQRGYNLAALDPYGNLLESVSFDTHWAVEASFALADWINRWPVGTVIAGAVADEASHQLQAPAVEALQRLGVSGDLRNKFRWSHALIGVVGAAPGSALEEMELIRPATVWLGAPVDAEWVYGGVTRVRYSYTVVNAGPP
jgi:hypothetical protein